MPELSDLTRRAFLHGAGLAKPGLTLAFESVRAARCGLLANPQSWQLANRREPHANDLHLTAPNPPGIVPALYVPGERARKATSLRLSLQL